MAKWAILVGIDVYPADERLTLRGCLNDVRATRDLLMGRYGFERSQMLEMTSPEMHNPSNLGGLISATRPTYDNIVQGMRTIQKLCKKGDLMYFHFSGYGCTMPSIVPQFTCYPTYRDVVLVPFDILFSEGQKYLHDIEMSCFARQMVAEGCEVTLVLDSRARDHSKPVPSFDDRRSPHSLFTMEELSSASQGKHRSYFGTPLRDTWIWDPFPKSTYTMLASFNFQGRIFRQSPNIIERQDPATLGWQGYFTAWLHNALNNAVNDTFRALLHSIEMNAQEALQFEQEPGSLMWCPAFSGNTWRHYPGSQPGLYENLAPTYLATLEPLDATAPKLRVDAGAAQGLRVGDGLMVFDRSPTNTGAQKQATGMKFVGNFTISAVGALNSIAVSAQGVQRPANSLSLVALLAFDTSDCERPLPCRGHSWPIQQAVPPTTQSWQITKPSVKMKEDETTQQLKLARAARADSYARLLHLHHQPQSLPSLAHVSIVGGYRYHHEPALVYPDHSEDGTFHLLSGDTIVINIQNLTNQELHYHILHFDVAYSINVLHPSAEGHSTTIHPQGQIFQIFWRSRIGIEDNLDDRSDKCPARHVLKVIITSQITSFEGVQMNSVARDDLSEKRRHYVQTLLSTYEGAGNAPEVDLGEKVDVSRELTSDSQLVTQDSSWRCYDMILTVHRNAASLKASLGGT